MALLVCNVIYYKLIRHAEPKIFVQPDFFIPGPGTVMKKRAHVPKRRHAFFPLIFVSFVCFVGNPLNR